MPLSWNEIKSSSDRMEFLFELYGKYVSHENKKV